jgi:hypothetical protein
MGAVVKLNKFRKAKARDEQRKVADRNSVVHGMTPAERKKAAEASRREDRLLDGAKRTPKE